MPSNEEKLRALANAQRRAMAKIKDISHSTSQLTAIVERAATQQIDSQGARSGSRYRPLAASTVKQKQRLGFGNKPILVRTGALRQFISRSAIAQVTNNGRRLEISFSSGDTALARVAAIQQRGSRQLPSRQILVLDASDKAQIKQTIANNVTEIMKDAIKPGKK